MAITRFLQRLQPPRSYDDLPQPDIPVAVIGDLHGRADLLDLMLDRLAQHPRAEALRLVFVGDLIDRGPDSAGTLTRLQLLTQTPPPFASVICLMGNHERMLLDFLADPVAHGARWLVSGGDATLASFGISTDRPLRRDTAPKGEAATNPSEVLRELRNALAERLGPELIGWISACPTFWREDRLAICHAGGDPTRKLEDQGEAGLLWGHSAFLRKLRSDGLWVAHGHTIVSAPSAREGRIAVDTGAWRSGRLSAAVFGPGGLQFVSVQAL